MTDKICNDAKLTLSKIMLPVNAVIVFDIDETMIDLTGNIILPVLDLYNYARSIGLTPIFITARPYNDDAVDYTINQFKKHKICGNHLIYFRHYDHIDYARYKKYARKNIIDNGYNIVMSVGDMEWDIGEYGGIGILIPK